MHIVPSTISKQFYIDLHTELAFLHDRNPNVEIVFTMRILIVGGIPHAETDSCLWFKLLRKTDSRKLLPNTYHYFSFLQTAW